MSTPSTGIITLASCVDDLIAEASVQAPALACRLARARAFTDQGAARAIYPAGDGGNYFVHSACDPTTSYSVSIYEHGVCTCHDCVNRGGPCKHVLAVKLQHAASHLRTARQRAADYGTTIPEGFVALLARFVV